jgi:hypothetical protein
VTDEEIAAALDAAGDRLPASRPAGKGGRKRGFASWEEAYQARAVEVEGGHRRWTGATSGRSGTPTVSVGGQMETVYRLAFRWHRGRDPEGNVLPACSYPHCVAGGHLADRRMRQGGGS